LNQIIWEHHWIGKVTARSLMFFVGLRGDQTIKQQTGNYQHDSEHVVRLEVFEL
jgi:hypothetical protein